MLKNIVEGLDSFFIWLNSALKQNLADYCDLETAQDEITMVSKDGSLLSVLRIDGYKSLINTSAYFEKISEPITAGLDPFFIKAGHMMQVWFSVDPSKSEKTVRDALNPSYETIKRLGLDLKEILDERVANLSQKANYEECYIVLWTRPSILVKSDIKQELIRKRKMRNEQVAPTKQAQDVFAGNSALQNNHTGFVESVLELFRSVNVACELLTVHDAARSVRTSIDDEFTSAKWEPSLPGDPISPNVRREKIKGEEWDIVWPKLSWQVCQRDATIVAKNVVEIGNKVYAPGYIDLLPKTLAEFDVLFSTLQGSSFPWRISFNIEGDGLAAVTTRSLFASILGFTSGDNRALNKGVEVLKSLREAYNDTVVKIRIAFCTWGPKNQVEKVEGNLASLSTTIEGWGGCLVSQVTGDPIAGMMSSALGATYNSVATYSAAPLGALPFMMPFGRPSSAWTSGSVLFLSQDGKLIPYQPGSKEQSTWIQLYFAKPGSGKSVLMNITNLALCLAPGIERLPRIGIVDIGPSSSGLISLIKESLPFEQRHLAQYHRLRMTEEYCINPFDTQLGCRFPTASDRAFLNNFLLLLVTDPSKDKPEDAMTGLVQAVIEDMYTRCADLSSPKKYDKGIDLVVDNAIKKCGIEIDSKETWWEIVDKLFIAGKHHEASMAQRYAVPLLSDAATSAQDDKIRYIYSNVQVGTSETLIQYFNRSITENLIQYKILARPTIFDISEARVISLDLDEVAKTGGVQADRQTAVMYMLARYILGKDFKIDITSTNEMPYPDNAVIPASVPALEYKAYHKKRIDDCKEDYKRLCFDEFHRTSKSPMVRDQVLVDMREGRKWKIDVSLASQSISDFDERMKSFATGIFIMDGGNEKDIKELIETFGMDDDAEKHALSKGRVKAPGSRGQPGVFMAKFVTETGKYTQLLSAHIGAIEMWALSTTAEDAAVRSRMYEKVGPSKARSILAKHYPHGLKRVVDQRKLAMKNNRSYTDDDSNLYIQIVEELLKKEGLKQ